MKNRVLNTELFIKRCKEIYDDKYDYSKTNYVKYYEKVKVYCKHCKKYFFVTPANHLKKRGCPYCKKVHLSETNRKDQAVFIKEAKKIHGNKYDYSEVNYINNRVPVKIRCKQCNTIFLSIDILCNLFFHFVPPISFIPIYTIFSEKMLVLFKIYKFLKFY